MDDETYIQLLLADSNLPTGSFVASSGLESFSTHGLLSLTPSKTDGTLAFVQDNLHNHAHSALPFTSDAHSLVCALSESSTHSSLAQVDQTLAALIILDRSYESMTLNHVTRRASTAQGTAMLTLHARAFAPSSTSEVIPTLIDNLKLAVRRGEAHGHLPVCWGVLTAALGLSLGTQHLALFLHARSILSAAVRMNTIGPYLAQQMLLSDIKHLVDTLVAECRNLRSGMLVAGEDDSNSNLDPGEMTYATGPASTWPLGEIVAVRHDLQHSRIFNS
ncbi:hypothetical protein F5141DRAFT_1009875 [Pisolithus sp. B1]|nr:hypothetical protein F5141DRAFT_1009875 [Pisolithus sp. B1]